MTIPDSKNKITVPFGRSYWVVPGKLLAGCYPGSENSEERDNKLKGLLDHGIRHVINLMEPHEANWDGESFIPYEERMAFIADPMGINVTFKRMPIKDFSVPTRAEMIRILDHIDKWIGEGTPVYIHCWGGRGRTGTVAGCYLARHGYGTGKMTIKLIQNLRENTRDRAMSSPENSQQIEMVTSWVEGE